ncbi:hypothetical protein ACFQLX_16100 [Streptomyces polyrhachis]|uniref:Uncharacterized protein n=1 Tax=Streptomyces polyrhachis TaxID=1282885 RepID=A0ABW2GG23_9ACTN
MGGHTIDDPVTTYGMAVVELAYPAHLFAIGNLADGDRLIRRPAHGRIGA